MDGACEYLVLPGYGGSGPEHWQTRWEADNPAYRRVEQEDWENPVLERWIARLDEAIAATPSPKILVAHSLACLLVAHWAGRAAPASVARVTASLLVAPPDPAGPMFPAEARGFSGFPRARLPFRSLVVSSSNDPYGTWAFHRDCARAWGGDLAEVGAKGHINAASALGRWEEGQRLLATLADRAASAGP